MSVESLTRVGFIVPVVPDEPNVKYAIDFLVLSRRITRAGTRSSRSTVLLSRIVTPPPAEPLSATIGPPAPGVFEATIIVPAFNESENIAQVVAEIRALGRPYEILVVDDCSTDDTRDIALAAGARVLKHPYNKGNGAAVKTGIRNAKSDKVVIIDGDGQHPAEMIPEIVSRLDIYDLVVGARTRSSETHWFRDLGNWVFNSFGSLVAGCVIPDLTSGFRGMRLDIALEFIHMFPNGFSLPTTSTLSVITAGYNINYIPIVARKRKGKSKIRPFQDGLRFLYIIVRVAVNFKPMRVFGPIALLFFVMGVGATLYYRDETEGPAFRAWNVMLFIFSMQVLVFGLISEQIAALRFSLGKAQNVHEKP